MGADTQRTAREDRARAGAQRERLGLERIYVKDLSFETPNSPSVFRLEWQPSVELQLSSDGARIGENLYEVVLRVTATVSLGDKTAFLAEVNQAGIFAVADVEDEARLKSILGSQCPSILFPYARETISDLVTRGGFPQFLLAPVDFDALYARHLEEQEEAGGASTPTPDP